MDSCVTVAIVNNSNQVQSFGSGVAIHAGGYIATNYHVISSYVDTPSAYSVITYINGDMDTSYDTKVLWYDAKLDVAVCQVKIDLPYVSMKDRVIYPATNQNLRVLEQVIAIGDNINDKMMIENAGLGISMGDSALSSMEIGDYITANNNESGVGQALNKFIN